MSLTALFVTAFVVGLSGALAPGPLLTVTIEQAGRRGPAAGPLVVAGHAVAEIAVVLGLTAGLSAVLALPAVTGGIGVLGGSILLWMGYGILRGALNGTLSLSPALETSSKTTRAPGWTKPVLAGVLASISNPYWILWWATVGATYVVLAAGRGALHVAAFFAGHITSDAVWLFFVALVVASGRTLISNRLYRGIVGACGVFLLGLSVYFLYYGFVTIRLASAL